MLIMESAADTIARAIATDHDNVAFEKESRAYVWFNITDVIEGREVVHCVRLHKTHHANDVRALTALAH